MRLSNRSKIGFYNFLNTIVIMIVLVGIALFLFEKYKLNVLGWESSLFLLIPAAIVVIVFLRGKQIFEYDSDGEVLIFKNRNVISAFGKVTNDEFPKYKLKRFGIVNFILFKKLYIMISSKKSESLMLRYDISYLSKREIRDLKISLSKVVKTNQEKSNKTNE